MDARNPFPDKPDMCNMLRDDYKSIANIPNIARKGPFLAQSIEQIRNFFVNHEQSPSHEIYPRAFADAVADYLVAMLLKTAYKDIIPRVSGQTINLTAQQLAKMNPNKDVMFFKILFNAMLYLQYNDTLWVASTTGGVARAGDPGGVVIPPVIEMRSDVGESRGGDGESRREGGESRREGGESRREGGESRGGEPLPTRGGELLQGGEERGGTDETGTGGEPAPAVPGSGGPAPAEAGSVVQAAAEAGSGEPAPAEAGSGEPAPAEPGSVVQAAAEAGSVVQAAAEAGSGGPPPAEQSLIYHELALYRGKSIGVLVQTQDDVEKLMRFSTKVSERYERAEYKLKVKVEDNEYRLYATERVRDQFNLVLQELMQRPTLEVHQALQLELTSKQGELTRVSDQMKTLISVDDHNDLKGKKEAIEKELVTARNERDGLQGELVVVRRDLSTAQNERDGFKEELVVVRRDLSTAQNERDNRIPLSDHQNLQSELETVKRQLQAAKDELKVAVEEKKDYVSPTIFNSLKRQLEEQKGRADQLDVYVQECSGRPTKIQHDFLKEEIKTKDEEISALHTKVAELKELKLQVRTLGDELEFQRTLVANFRQANDGKADDGSNAMLQTLNELKEAKQTAVQNYMQALDELDENEKRISELEKQLREIPQSSGQTGVDVTQLQGDLENARRALSAAEEEKKRLHDALDEAVKEKTSSGEKLGEESRLKEAANAAKAEADQEIDRLKAANAEAERRLLEAVTAAGNPLPPPIPAGSQADAVNLREQEVRRREDEVHKQELYTDFMAVVKTILGEQEMDSIAGNSHREKALDAVRKLASNARITAIAHRTIKIRLETDCVPKEELEKAIAMNKLQHDYLIGANLGLLVLAFQTGKLKKEDFTSITVPLQEAVFRGSGEMLRWANSRTKIFPLFENDAMWQSNIVSAIMLGVGHATITDDARSMHDAFQYLEKITPEESFKEFLGNPSRTELNLIESCKNYKPIVFPIPRLVLQALEDMRVDMPPILLYFLCLMPQLIHALLTKPDEIGDAMENPTIFDHVTFRLDYLTMQHRLEPVASEVKNVWDTLKGTHLERTVQMAYLISSFIRQQQSAGARVNRPARAAPLRPSGAGGAAGDGGAAGAGGAGGAAGAGGAGGAAGAGSAGAAAGDGGFGA
jgi:hypothetical protein